MRLLMAMLAAGIALTGAAAAQDYPTKPVHLVVPFPPGGAVDIVARVIGNQLSQSWKQQVVVENRPGAGGVVATEYLAKSAPDGYTLILVATGHSVGQLMYKKLPYDTFKDFVAISEVGYSTNILLVGKSLPVNSVAELIAYAKERPGKLTYGMAGNGTTPHLAGEMFKYMAKVDIVALPYKGGAPVLNDLVGGQIPMSFNNVPESIEQIRAGTVRALGVTQATRSPILPDVPTIGEILPGYENVVWWGLLAPAGAPKPVVAKIHDGVVSALRAPEVKQRFTQLGAETVGSTPEEFDRLIHAEAARWAPIIKAANIHAD